MTSADKKSTDTYYSISFGECLWVMNVEDHAAHGRMANVIIVHYSTIINSRRFLGAVCHLCSDVHSQNYTRWLAAIMLFRHTYKTCHYLFQQQAQQVYFVLRSIIYNILTFSIARSKWKHHGIPIFVSQQKQLPGVQWTNPGIQGIFRSRSSKGGENQTLTQVVDWLLTGSSKTSCQGPLLGFFESIWWVLSLV